MFTVNFFCFFNITRVLCKGALIVQFTIVCDFMANIEGD